jgi:ABC-type glycerol-3-phosphate transport system permease component
MRRRYSGIPLYLAAVLVALWVLLPYYWTFTTSISNFVDLSSAVIFPRRPVLGNYESILLGKAYAPGSEAITGAQSATITMQMINSLVVALGVVVITLILATPAAYSHSRLDFRGKGYSFMLIFIPRIVPVMVMALPFFILFLRIHLVNTHLGLILVHSLITIPMATWILRDFLDGIPKDYEEAAMVDGATRFQALRKVLAPLLSPGLIAVATFALMTSWGEFFFALTLTENLTLPPYILSFRTPQKLEYGELAASVILASIPPFALASVLQRYLTKAIVGGGLKQ